MRQKIVHVTEALGGGVLQYLLLLANSQARAGDDVVIIHSMRSDTPSSERLDRLFDPRVRRRVIDMKTAVGLHDLWTAPVLAMVLRSENADIFHFHSSKAAAIGRISAKILGIGDRVLYSPHGFAFLKKDISPRKAKAYLSIERFLHALGGHIVTCSKSERLYASRLLGRSDRISVVENAVELTDFSESDATRGRRAVTVCTAGRVTYQKAPWRFSRIAKRAKRDAVDFVWFGDGESTAVSEWIDRDALELTGWIESSRLRKQLAECDVFVLTSLWEGMPIALIEAQAAGLPAVVSRIVGNRDVVIHGVTGFLANNDEELFLYTERLINDSALRMRMGAAAREFAFRRFGGHKFFSSYVRLYRQLLNGPQRHHPVVVSDYWIEGAKK